MPVTIKRTTGGWTRSMITSNGATVYGPRGGVYSFRSADPHGELLRAFHQDDGTMANPQGEHTWSRARIEAIPLKSEGTPAP